MKEEKTGEESAERCSSPALGAVHCALGTVMVLQRRARASQQGQGSEIMSLNSFDSL